MKYLIKILISLIFIMSLLNVSAMNSGTTNSGTIIQEDSFKLNSVKVIYDNELLLNFNHTLANIEGLGADLKINELNNKFNTFQIDDTTISGSIINVKLKTTLNTNTDYEIKIIQVLDINGNNITQGVNAYKIFKTPIIFDIPKTINTISNSGNTNSGIELNSASDINLNNIFKNAIPTKTSTASIKTNNTFDTAKNNKKLPTTGPAEWLLLAISLFLGLIYFTFKISYKN